MTVKELINKLLETHMDNEAMIYLQDKHIDEEQRVRVSGYLFDIKEVHFTNGITEIAYDDWRKKEMADHDVGACCRFSMRAGNISGRNT